MIDIGVNLHNIIVSVILWYCLINSIKELRKRHKLLTEAYDEAALIISDTQIRINETNKYIRHSKYTKLPPEYKN